MHLRFAVKTVYQKLQVRFKFVCRHCENAFQDLLNTMEQFAQKLSEGINADFCNPPHNTQWIAESINSKHDWWQFHDINFLSGVLHVMMEQ